MDERQQGEVSLPASPIGQGKHDVMMRKRGSKMSVSGRGGKRCLAALTAVVAACALGLADAAVAAQQNGQVAVAAPAAAPTAPGEGRVSPHVLAARKRAAGAPAAHTPITLQTQMQKRAARRQVLAGTRK
jgi:hypothetical protein